MSLAPGTMVNANVRLIELLGKGGMGSVWLADHLGLEARVAVKFIDPQLVRLEPSLRERFKREASICARIRSIHVVQTFDHGVMNDGTPYIVMELLEGTSLTHRIETAGAMSLEEVGMMIGQVAKVLHRAHVLGIVHRDIKPDNIFLCEDDYDLFVKVLDFGIAKETRAARLGAVTKTGVIVGTPEFMSPEQAVSSKSIDYRADLFSLGVVAYYALTTELPWRTDATSDDNGPLWLQMSKGQHVPVDERNPFLPPEFNAFFTKALQPAPEDRFQSAKDMANAFVTLANAFAAGVVDEFSNLDDSLSLPRKNLRPDTIPVEEESEPAMYDLLGPESDEYGSENTLWMDRDDHQEAEARGEGPPTQRRPMVPRPSQPSSPSLGDASLGDASLGDASLGDASASHPGASHPGMPAAAPPAAYMAVRSGAYNTGLPGAYNALVAGSHAAALPIAAAGPRPVAVPSSQRRRLPLALIVALATVTVCAIVAVLLSLST